MLTRRGVIAAGGAVGLAATKSVPAVVEVTDPNLKLWYRQPAASWVEALPIGNGRLAAMVFGGVQRERVQLNEDTLWGGGPYDPANPKAREGIPRLRELIDAKR